MPKKQESVEEALEAERTQAEKETLDELEETPEPEDETSEPESTEEETEPEEEKEEKEPEESFEQKLDRLAQAKKDKELKPLYKERDGLRTRVTELEGQLNDKIWDRELQSLFNEDVENLGEDEAEKRKANRAKIAEQVKDFRQKSNSVENTIKKLGNADLDGILKDLDVSNLDEGINKLGVNIRDYKARSEVWKLLFPEDKQKVEKVEELVKKFAKAQDPDDFEIILESIKESTKSKQEKFVPDSGKQAGGKSGLSGDEAILAGLRKEQKIRR
uniref:Uncharacterized protein n=1 Tax=viral metagenome TaxID=1070528 RepID=A0A6M3IVF4_9ZZZZ